MQLRAFLSQSKIPSAVLFTLTFTFLPTPGIARHCVVGASFGLSAGCVHGHTLVLVRRTGMVNSNSRFSVGAPVVHVRAGIGDARVLDEG